MEPFGAGISAGRAMASRRWRYEGDFFAARAARAPYCGAAPGPSFSSVLQPLAETQDGSVLNEPEASWDKDEAVACESKIVFNSRQILKALKRKHSLEGTAGALAITPAAFSRNAAVL